MTSRSEENRALLDMLPIVLDQMLAERAAANAPPPEPFVDWLFDKAQTELGNFPDWPYLRRYAEALVRAAETGKTLMVLKRRQILISWVTAAYYHWSASRFPYNHSAALSAGEREAKKQGRRIKYIAEKDGYPVRGVDLIVYPNGSEINILPATEVGGIGESLPGGAHFDEYSKHPYGESNLAAITPSVVNSGGSTLITSTTHPGMGEAGCFFDVWQGDEDFLSEDPDFYYEDDSSIRMFFGRDCRPDQGDEYIESQRLVPGVTDENMAAYYPRSPAEAFRSRTGLVFPQFSKGLHVMPAEVPWEKCLWRVVGYDPGGRDPAGLVAVGVYPAHPINPVSPSGVRGQWRHHVYATWRTEGAISAYDVRDWVRGQGYAGVHKVFVGETGGATLIETLKAMKLPAFKPPMAKKEGIGHMRWMLENGYLTVDSEMKELIDEFGQYWIHEGRQTLSPRGDTFPTTTPAHHHADLLDALRYAVMGILMTMPRPSATVEQAGTSAARWERAG